VSVLGVDKEKTIVIVGAGNMGRALARHGNFGRYGFYMRGIFDIDPQIIGDKVGEFKVQGMEVLADFVIREGIDIGVIAVPSQAAQEGANGSESAP